MTPSELIVESRRLLNDTVTPYRYSDAMLLGYVNQVLKRTAVLRPDLFGVVSDITVTADDTIQSLPADAHRLIDIFQVKGGNTVTEVDRETMSRTHPSWMSDPAGIPVNYMRHIRNPTKFFVYPKPSSTIVLIGEYAVSPPDYTINEQIVSPPPSFFGALVDGILFLASSVDDEHVNTGRAKLFLDSYTQQLGVSLQNRALSDTKIAGMNPAPTLARIGEVY